MTDTPAYDSEEINAKLKSIKAVVVGDTLFFGKSILGSVVDALNAEGAVKQHQIGLNKYADTSSIGDSNDPPGVYFATGWKVNVEVIKAKFSGIDVFENSQVKDTKALLAERGLLSPGAVRSTYR